MSQFKDKILLITGGTGSFGNVVLELFSIELNIFNDYMKKMNVKSIKNKFLKLGFIRELFSKY